MGNINVIKDPNVNVISFDNVKVKIRLAEVGTLKGEGRRGEGTSKRSNDGLILKVYVYAILNKPDPV